MQKGQRLETKNGWDCQRTASDGKTPPKLFVLAAPGP
ncbi:hypothetical protein CLOLEP_00906 [[Clostridium] leptum DSM 753]|uniref:Uncharacterized protein n=1 Tax=[Clostridium] leptum DSM 753 TaxID=428125 RepID=A7VQS4_9FIRM|nr:hypothetical protein CLOLEP_00906 [[Clostridium] leptum DSM 753]